MQNGGMEQWTGADVEAEVEAEEKQEEERNKNTLGNTAEKKKTGRGGERVVLRPRAAPVALYRGTGSGCWLGGSRLPGRGKGRAGGGCLRLSPPCGAASPWRMDPVLLRRHDAPSFYRSVSVAAARSPRYLRLTGLHLTSPARWPGYVWGGKPHPCRPRLPRFRTPQASRGDAPPRSSNWSAISILILITLQESTVDSRQINVNTSILRSISDT